MTTIEILSAAWEIIAVLGSIALTAGWWVASSLLRLEARVRHIERSIERLRSESSEQHSGLADRVDQLVGRLDAEARVLADLRGYLRGAGKIE